MAYPAGLFVIDRAPVAGYMDDEAPKVLGPAVVLVHGTLDRGNSFRRSMRRLEDVRVVTYDRRGYQDSRAAGPTVGVQGHIDDLLEVIRTVGGRPVVVGHSLGGLIALGAAVAEPERVSAVGAYEPPVRWIPVEGHEERPQWSPSDDPDEAVETFFRRQVGDETWERLEPAAKADRLADGPALLADLTSIGETPLFDLTGLSVPATFGVGGRSDRYHKDNVAWMVSHVPGARGIEIGEAGHGAHLTHPDAFADFVRTVMARSSEADAVGAPAAASDG